MSEFTFSVEKVTGVASDSSACSVFSKRISLSDGSIGTLVGCILASSGKEYVGIVVSDMFDLTASKLEGMDSAILESLVAIRDTSFEFAQSHKVDVSFAYVFFYEDVCYVVRSGDKVKVHVFDGPRSAELSFESGSGPVAVGQVYLIASEKFLSDFDTSVLAHEEEIDFADVIDGLATQISSKDDQSEIGAVFVQVKGEAKRKAKKVEAEEEVVQADETAPVEEPASVAVQQAVVDERGDDQLVAAPNQEPKAGIFATLMAAVFREFKKLKGGEVEAKGRLRRNIVILAFLVFLILAGSGSYTLYKNYEKKKLANFEMHLTTASGKLNEGTSIIELNRSRAREIFVEADREVKLALTIVGDSQKAKSLEEDIAGKLKETEASDNISFTTVGQVEGGAQSVAVSGKSLVVSSQSAIYEIDPRSSSENIVAVVSAKSINVSDNRVFALTDDKVLGVDLATGQLDELFDHSGAQDIGVFFGNVYLLGVDKIDKYVPVESGYFGPADYLSGATQFSNKSRFAIDGLIWVTSGNKILKFNRGEKEDFEILGLADGVGEFGAIYTTSSLDNLYVIDTVNWALLVVGADGTYKKAYQAPDFGRATDLAISDDGTKVYITVENKVLEANLE